MTISNVMMTFVLTQCGGPSLGFCGGIYLDASIGRHVSQGGTGPTGRASARSRRGEEVGPRDEPLGSALVPHVHPIPVVSHQENRFPPAHGETLLSGLWFVLLHDYQLFDHGLSVGVGECNGDIIVW